MKELQKTIPTRNTNNYNLGENTIKDDIENKESSNYEKSSIDNSQNIKKTSNKGI